MTDDSDDRERRTRQFEHYFGLMEHRRLRLLESDCFLVFSIAAPPDVPPRIGGSKTRTFQFAFTETEFFLDLPDTSLTLEEAKRW